MRGSHKHAAIIMAGLIAMAPLVDAVEDITENFVYEDMALVPPSHRFRLTPVGEYCFARAWGLYMELPYVQDNLRDLMAWTAYEFAKLADKEALELV